jgi:TonB family protein
VIRDHRLAICALLSIVGHVAFATGLRHLPRRDEPREKRVLTIRVISPPPPPPPVLEPEAESPKTPEAPPPKLAPHERPRARTVAAPVPAPPPTVVPAADSPATGATAAPVFGVTMESTSQAGNGPAMRVGGGGPRPGPLAPEGAQRGAGAALGEPVAAYDVTVMPLPQGRCVGKYTDEAKQAAIEGTVVLDLVVGADGRTRDIRVVSGLAHGLTQAAIEALKTCRFTPGEKDGTPVPVRVRGFKIRFVMQEND